MSGKSYTMKEMKAIVEYLTEHRAYNEIKGRKMWMDLARSKVTNRTWQSLKETFLKRILPDIHNPYYKLSLTQISSFRQGQDIETRLNNRLQLRSTSQDTDDVKEQNAENPGNSNNLNEDKTAGEDPIASNRRDSTETLLIENYYASAEEIRKDLESPTDEVEEEKEKPTKTMRELIIYSEPLTPMLQSVIDDFVTDEEEEPKMQIVEPEETTDKNDQNVEENITIEISDSEGNELREETNQTKTNDVDQTLSPDKNEHAIKESKTKETEVTKEVSTTLLSETNDTTNEKDEMKNAEDNNAKTSTEVTQDNSASTADTFLPGNQEALEENLKTIPEKRSSQRLNKKTNVENGRKRASSQDPEPKTKKRILSKLKSISDSENSAPPTNGNVFQKSKFSIIKQSLPEESDNTFLNVHSEKYGKMPIQDEAAEILQDTVMKSSAEIENPCLKNVSLYAEEFSTEKYVDSDTSNVEDDKNEKVERNNKNKDIEVKNKQKNDEIEKTHDNNKNSKDISDKIINENEKRSDKIEDTVDNNKIIDLKNKNAEDKNKKIKDNEKANDKIEKMENKKEIGNNDKTDDKNNKNYKSSSNASKTQDIKSKVQDNENDVIMLGSHSGSVTESGNDARRGEDRLVRQNRDSALANMFGFASGATSRRQRRVSDRRKRAMSHSHNIKYSKYEASSASGGWTSDSGSEYVSSPPRRHGRKGRHTRKYLKPRSAPILSLEEEGGLFVIHNKKIYPLVHDGKSVKNYVSYTPADDIDPEESYWKLKYVEEKKKSAELTKLLNQAKEKESQAEPNRVPPVSPTTAQNSHALTGLREDTPLQGSSKNVAAASPVKAPEPNPISEEKKTVKIKFIKNNEEVELEGHWSQIHPVLGHVAQLFQKQPESVTPSVASSKTDSLAPGPIVESRKSTPIDEVLEKVNRREMEIAQEIERRYHKEETNASETIPQPQNVTKRKGRQRKSSPAVPPSPAKVARHDDDVAEKTEQPTAGESSTTVMTRRTRTPKPSLSETVEPKPNTTVRTRKNTAKKSLEKTADDTKQADAQELDDGIRYKLPPANRKSKTNAKNTSPKNAKSTTNLFSSPENNSIESTQGYQDSDISPSSICSKKRRKSSFSFITHRKRYKTRVRQRSHHADMTSDSSNSFQGSRINTITFQNSTLTSEIYRSESYRLLMNKDPKHNNNKNTSKLEIIVETSPASKYFELNVEANNEYVSNGNIDLNNKENTSELLHINTDENSSNVSMPTSPVLSIVENISISKSCMELLSSMEHEDYPIDDKGDVNDTEQITLNRLMTPNDDVIMPLMEQDYGIEKSHQDGKAYHYNMSISKTDTAISDSLLNKINTVNIQEPSLTDTLNIELRNLLLESAKKIHKDNTAKNEIKNVGKSGPKKANSRKRSSTPRKRQSTHKQTLANAELDLIDEHIESCSRLGRQTCPPSILITEHDGNELSTPVETELAQFLTVKPTKGKKKEDIIKVKITKPKSKTQDNYRKKSNKTNFSDSGINNTESEIKLLASDDSVELIHNHSETCLDPHKCMGDCVQIIHNVDDSIMSLQSNTAHSDIVRQHTVGDIFDKQEIYSTDAQDGSDVIKEFDFAAPRQVKRSPSTTYHTPIGTQSSGTSIITDDLSDETPEQPVRSTDWYLFTEDEYSNSNCFNTNKKSDATGCGSRLEQIFPITCAVPDLSTITEMSKENGDSKKNPDDTNTRDLLNSSFIFD